MRAIATTALALLLMTWSVATILVDAIVTPTRTYAELIEAGVVGKQYISASTDWVDMTLASLSVCPRDLVRSAVSIELAALDAARKNAASTEWEARLAATGRLLRHGLRCFPLDGNMWLRLAMVEFAGAGPTSTVEEMLRLSADTAPSEAWIVAPRILFAARLMDFPLPGARLVLEKDIATFAQHGNVIEVGALYAQVGAQTRLTFDAQIALIDSERRTALERAIESSVNAQQLHSAP